MADGSVLAVGDTLSEGQFIVDGSGNYFAGILERETGCQFGVWAGRPEDRQGTSITLCFPCRKLVMTSTALTGFADPCDPQPSWTSPPGTGPCFAVMQSDGNLCVYEGEGPGNHGALLWGSLQSGGVVQNFKPYPEFGWSDVSVQTMDGMVEGAFWCIQKPVGATEFTNLPNVEVSGRTGDSCCLTAAWPDPSGGPNFSGGHNSGDNFTIGEKGVKYELSTDTGFSSNRFSWRRTA